MSRPLLLFPETKPDDRDDGEWLLCPTCHTVAELDAWEVCGRSIVVEETPKGDIVERYSTDDEPDWLWCPDCQNEVTPLAVSERKRK